MGVCGSKNDDQPPVQRQRAQDNMRNVQPAPQQSNSSVPAELREVYGQVCPTHGDHMLFESEVTPLLQIKNANNLNNRYTYMYKVDESKMVGKDIKKTNAYASRIPLEELKKKRKEFWGRTLLYRYENRGHPLYLASIAVCL